jgi:hypothetical protein
MYNDASSMVIPKCNYWANPPITSYNAGVVNFYNATGSLARFEIIIIFFFLKNVLAYYNAGVVPSCKFKSRRIGSWKQKARLNRCIGFGRSAIGYSLPMQRLGENILDDDG